MKKTFVAYTEKGRVRGKISGSILKLEDKFQFCTEFQLSPQSHKGFKEEVVSKLVEAGELPEEALDAGGYPNYDVVNRLANILIIEGRGINYCSIV